MTLGWNVANLSRAKKLKPLADYLRPEATPEQQRDKGARDVMAMLDRMERREAENGAR